MTSRKTKKRLHEAADSGRDALRETIAAGAAGARALQAAMSAATQQGREQAHKRSKAHDEEEQHGRRLPWAKAKPATHGRHKAKSKADRQRKETSARTGKVKLDERKRGRRRPPGPAAHGVPVRPAAAPFTALGWCLLAGVILAWPRERSEHRLEGRVGNHLTSLRDRLRDELTSPSAHIADAEGQDPGLGRQADTPAEIPPRGWLDILKRSWSQFLEDRVTAVAGGITFFGLLALFPAMAAFVSLYGLVADTKTVSDHLRILAGVIPAEALKFVGEQMVRMATTNGSSLGFTFFGTLLVSLWSANVGVKAMFDGLNVAYEEKEKRGLIKLNLVSLAFTLGAIAFLVLATASVIAIPIVLGMIGWKLGGLGAVLDLLRWPVLLLGAAGGLAVLYRYGPSRQRAKWAWITPGSVAGALLWLGASMLFSFYVAHFGSYNKTYGSLGAVVGFLTWMWISAIIILFGAELNSEIEHQTAVDSTTGAPQPLGARGARMADTIAAAPKQKPA